MEHYCEACGSRMVRVSKEPFCYDGKTGKLVYKLKLCCPNKKHWWDKHHNGKWIVWDKEANDNPKKL